MKRRDENECGEAGRRERKERERLKVTFVSTKLTLASPAPPPITTTTTTTLARRATAHQGTVGSQVIAGTGGCAIHAVTQSACQCSHRIH